MKNLADITSILVGIEQRVPVDRLIYKGLHVWPLIRVRIANDLFWDVTAESAAHNSPSQTPITPEAENDLFAQIEASLATALDRTYDALFFTVGFEYAAQVIAPPAVDDWPR